MYDSSDASVRSHIYSFQEISTDRRTQSLANRMNRRENPEWRMRLSVKLKGELEAAQSCQGEENPAHTNTVPQRLV